MTVAFFSGRARRAGVVLGAVSAGLLVLAACDKPTPLATVTVGTRSVNSGANCYNDGKAIPAKDATACLQKKAENNVKVTLTDQVHIGVDPTVAHHGWAVFVDGQPIDSETSKQTYRTFPAAQFFSPDPSTGQPAPAKRQISIVEIDGQTPTGFWNVTIQKDS